MLGIKIVNLAMESDLKGISNNIVRKACCRAAAACLGCVEREPLPMAMVNEIRNAFCNPDGHHMGFKAE